MKEQKITLDAAKFTLGRLASKVAIILQGKDKTTYRRNIVDKGIVEIININDVKITGKKAIDKIFYDYSGYPGGMKLKKLQDISKKNVFLRVVKRMLPDNKLRQEYIKRLTIE